MSTIAASPSGVSQWGVLRSEWTKFRSIRSTRWTLLVAVILTVGLGALLSALQASHSAEMSPEDQTSFNPIQVSLAGASIAELAMGVLGVLVISSEYSTGMIRASLTSVPRRLPVLWGKLAVTFGVSLVVMLASSFIAFFLGQALLNRRDLGTTITAHLALQSVIGAAVAVALLAMIGTAIGALLRSTAGAISAFVGVLFVLPPLLALLPGSWGDDIDPYLPSSAAQAVMGGDPDSSTLLGFWKGLAVLVSYVVVLAIAAAWQLRRSDP